MAFVFLLLLLFVPFDFYVSKFGGIEPASGTECVVKPTSRFLEIQIDQQCARGILLCYQSPLDTITKWAEFPGAKIGRRFQVPNLPISATNANFDKCNGSRGIIISLRSEVEDGAVQQRFNMEMSTGIKFSCSIDRNIFGIDLHAENGILSSVKGCKESWSCEKAAKLTKAFGIEERGQQNFGLFLEDYADVSLLGVELLQTSNDTIERISLCDNYQWKVDILNATKQISCGQMGPKQLIEQRNRTEPMNKLEFHLNLYNLACNFSMTSEAKKEKDRTRKSQLRQKACYWVQNECNSWNTVEMTACYDSVLDSPKIIPELRLGNQPGNPIAELCENKRPRNGSSTSVRHGFSIKTCVRRSLFLRKGDKYEIAWTTNATLSLSYSDQIYEFAWTQPAEGKISRHQIKGRNESENLLPPFQDPVTNLNPDYIQLFAIGLNNSFDSAKNKISLGAKLAHLNKTMSKYYWGIIGGTTAEMQHLLQHDNALALLSFDLFGQNNDLKGQSLQLLTTPANKCFTVNVTMNNSASVIRPECQQPQRNDRCEKIGRANYDKWVQNVKKLKNMYEVCKCPGDDPGPLPTWVTPNKSSVASPKLTREKRSSQKAEPKQNDAEGVNEGCNDTYTPDLIFSGDVIKRPEEVEKEIAGRTKCCKNETTRRKRQLISPHIDPSLQVSPDACSGGDLLGIPGLWPDSTKIIYEISEEVEEDLHHVVTEGLQLIESVTCLRFEEFDGESGSDVKRIIFQRRRGFWSYCASHIGTCPREKTAHDVDIGDNCFNRLPRTMAHETMHALGILHEWARSDRNQWVWVNPNWFEGKLNDTYQLDPPLAFEFDSLMLYGAKKFDPETHAFAHDETFQHTFETLARPVTGTLTYKDAKILNILYCTTPTRIHNNPKFDDKGVFTRCDRNSEGWKKSRCLINGGYPDPMENCKKCRCPMGYKSGGNDCTQIEDSDKNCGETELIAIPQPKSLSYMAKNVKQKCIWRIKTNQMDPSKMRAKISVEFVELSFLKNSTRVCEEWLPCNEWLEVKAKEDKTTTGARICCKLIAGPMPVITAQEYDQEVLIILHDPNGTAQFKLNFKAAHQFEKRGEQCPPVTTLWNPEGHPISNAYMDCGAISCDQVTWSARFVCQRFYKRLMVNGIEIVNNCPIEQLKINRECKERAPILCLITDNGEQHYFFEDKDGEFIRINKFDCVPREEPLKLD